MMRPNNNNHNNNNNNNNNQVDNAARILNMAVSNQMQQQQNFRIHQQRYLAPNPNRQPSQDDLFEMASMLLDSPEEEKCTTWINQSTAISPSNSMMINNPGMVSYNYALKNDTVGKRSSPTNVSSGDLFDDDELDSVLGDVSEPSKSCHFQTITPETSERETHVAETFLPETTLEEMLKSTESSTTTDQHNHDQWCLIDFGDDHLELPESSPFISFKRHPSFEEIEFDISTKKIRS